MADTKVIHKRFQYYSKDGIKFTDWFPMQGDDKSKWQTKGKLLNEYKEL